MESLLPTGFKIFQLRDDAGYEVGLIMTNAKEETIEHAWKLIDKLSEQGDMDELVERLKKINYQAERVFIESDVYPY